ncbi:MAG: Group II intron-encoded protein LtrA [bacterium ADurb.Bin429]|nr:MAG: Group II intron-encoded protein LtrA [bacterium ADurb.Bin429]
MNTTSAKVNTEAILNMQSKLYRWSRNEPEKVFFDLFNLVCDRRMLAHAWSQLCRNQGSRTPGIDGMHRRKIEEQQRGVEGFLEEIREELRNGTYRPQPVKQRLIPKPGKPGKYRPLGIPTLKDRLVQMALKNVLEPIFEADFYPTSYGFRRGRSTLDALAMIQKQLHPTLAGESAVQYIIEGDIKGCFDNIDHHLLMDAVRKRIGDSKVLRLILAFLKAGIMAEGNLRHSIAGTPQGGIISPLLANVYLTALDARYKRWTPGPNEPTFRAFGRRNWDKKHGRPCFYMIRYADDFVILVSGTQADAEREKAALAEFVRETLGMELSEEKTLITRADEGFNFLGYRVIKEPALTTGTRVGKLRIPQEKLQLLRDRLKGLTDRSQTGKSLEDLISELNPIIAGWRNYYRYAVGASRDFDEMDHWLWERIRLWLNKKHRRVTGKECRRRYTRQIKASRYTWGSGKETLQLFTAGGTKRYKCKGTRISNGWNDEIDGVRQYGEVCRAISGYTLTGTLLR